MNPGLPVVGFDLDMTLVWARVGHPEQFDDPLIMERVTFPRYDAIRQLQRAACVPVIITARTERVRYVTEKHVRRFTGLRDLVVHMQEEWRGRDAIAPWKAERIELAGCHAYVGDQTEDKEAARLAGVPFLHADRFARWGLSPLLPLLEAQEVVA